MSDAGWIVFGCSTTLVLEVPRFGCRLDSAWLYYNSSTGNASFGVLALLCWIVVQLSYWKCLVSDAGWIVLGCSITLVLEMPRVGSWLDCAGLQYNLSTGKR